MRVISTAEADLANNDYKNTYFRSSVAISPAAVATVTNTEQTFNTFLGLAAADQAVSVVKPTAQAGIGGAPLTRVTAADTLGLSWPNPTAGGVTPTASERYDALIYRP